MLGHMNILVALGKIVFARVNITALKIGILWTA